MNQGGDTQHNDKRSMPEARTDDLVIEELPDELLVYDLRNHRSHCLNQTLKMIWRHCDGHTAVADVAMGLKKVCSAPDTENGENVVWLALKDLEEQGLLQAPLKIPSAITGMSVAGMSRRQMVRALGLGAVVGLPVIASLIAPRAAQAQSMAPRKGKTRHH